MRFALIFVLTTLVATCGQKGPLELPPTSPTSQGSVSQGSAVAATGALR